MDQRQLLRLFAIGRMALGATLLVLPGRAGRRMVGAAADADGGSMLVRVAAVRDVALGYGTYRALAEDRDAVTWARLTSACDAGDAIAAVLGARRLGPARTIGSIIVAGGAAVLGFRAAADLPT